MPPQALNDSFSTVDARRVGFFGAERFGTHQLHPNEPHFSSMARLDAARPWSQGPSTALEDLKTMSTISASRGSLQVLRTDPSARNELTMMSQVHFPMFSRRGRGAIGYTNEKAPRHLEGAAYPIRPTTSTKSPLTRTPSTYSKRPLFGADPPKPKIEPWNDPMVAGLGYGGKFYSR